MQLIPLNSEQYEYHLVLFVEYLGINEVVHKLIMLSTLVQLLSWNDDCGMCVKQMWIPSFQSEEVMRVVAPN